MRPDFARLALGTGGLPVTVMNLVKVEAMSSVDSWVVNLPARLDLTMLVLWVGGFPVMVTNAVTVELTPSTGG